MIGIALFASTLSGAPAVGEWPIEVVCEGQYEHHLQGIATDGKAIYWSFTTVVVKTDLDGKVLARVEGPYHHGDLCYHDGRVYVAWSNHFNKPDADSQVWVYDAESLQLLEKHMIPEVTYGAGGMDYADGHFYVIGGLPHEIDENYVYEFDADFNHVETHVIPSGHTHLGIQTACFHDGRWWFGCYSREGNPGLLVCDADLNLLSMHDVQPSIGLIGWGEGRFLMAKHFGEKYQARAVPMVADEKVGLIPAD
ncbi:MAG: hypothetical protein ACQER1_02955 [Armatimonadota bacterium]